MSIMTFSDKADWLEDKMTNKEPEKETFTYPELLKKYFPGDEYSPEREIETQDTVFTKDNFYDFLRRVSRPDQPQPDKEESETSE